MLQCLVWGRSWKWASWGVAEAHTSLTSWERKETCCAEWLTAYLPFLLYNCKNVSSCHFADFSEFGHIYLYLGLLQLNHFVEGIAIGVKRVEEMSWEASAII